jgi:hypothetical protein
MHWLFVVGIESSNRVNKLLAIFRGVGRDFPFRAPARRAERRTTRFPGSSSASTSNFTLTTTLHPYVSSLRLLSSEIILYATPRDNECNAGRTKANATSRILAFPGLAQFGTTQVAEQYSAPCLQWSSRTLMTNLGPAQSFRAGLVTIFVFARTDGHEYLARIVCPARLGLAKNGPDSKAHSQPVENEHATTRPRRSTHGRRKLYPQP